MAQCVSYTCLRLWRRSGSVCELYLLEVVEAQWLSGRMPDSRSREHRHESPTHWRRWWRLVMALLRHDKTKSLYLYFAMNRDLFIYLLFMLLFV